MVDMGTANMVILGAAGLSFSVAPQESLGVWCWKKFSPSVTVRQCEMCGGFCATLEHYGTEEEGISQNPWTLLKKYSEYHETLDKIAIEFW